MAIQNHSDVTVTVRVTGLIDDAGQSIGDTLDLGPGERREAWFGVTRNVDEWVAIHTQRALGEAGVEATGLVYYLDPADTGATDRWELALTGTPLEPVPDMNGAWQLIDRPNRLSGNPGAMGVLPVLRERIYWLSKKRNQQLDP